MNNIAKSFNNRKGKAFIGFVVGGDPSLAKTKEFVLAMQEAGCNLIEIGVPFSDPVAEGPVIQRANLRALAGGATLASLLELVSDLRASAVHVPLVFLTYLNPVHHYGYEKFFIDAAEAGLDGIIVPDLPFEEHGELKPVAAKHGIALISMVSPTSDERIKMIAPEAAGFVYLVSSMGVTGMRNKISTDLAPIVGRIKSLTDVPVAVGFGVHDPAQAREISKTADGVIVGSAIVKIIEERGEEAGKYIAEYVKKMKASQI